MIIRILVAVLALSAAVSAAPQSTGGSQLTNTDVEMMLKAGLDEAVIVKAVETSPSKFDTSPTALISLKAAGATPKLLNAILAAQSASHAPQTPRGIGSTTQALTDNPHGIPNEVGVYALDGDKLHELTPEVVTFRTGGLLKSMATAGISGAHMNGTVRNAHSPNKLHSSVTFFIRTTEGVTGAEYQLLDLWEKDDRREFRAVSASMLRAKTGADKNLVSCEFERVGPRLYKAKLADLKRGEYGFLPPGAVASASSVSGGKLYSFQIVE